MEKRDYYAQSKLSGKGTQSAKTLGMYYEDADDNPP